MNKKIVIVGTSRGIGRALVSFFSKLPNCEIHCLSRSKGDIQESKNVFYHPFNLENKVSVQADAIFKTIGSIDILINNAGVLVNKPFPELTADDFQRSYQVNVIGVMQTAQCVLPYLNPTE
ncbi:MAG: SDR family oxidoreductase, partial [Bacteroidetes bacterium]|nr:SDR family oxidoreductase [Bacteroidota bacterium]